MRQGALIGMLAVVATGCAGAGGPLEPWIDASASLRYRPASPPAFPRESLSGEVARREEAARRETPPKEKPRAVAARPKPQEGTGGAKGTIRPASTSEKVASKPTTTSPAPRPADAREAVLATARSLVGKSQVTLDGKKYPSDCTGLIEATYARAGVSFRGTLKPGDNGVTAMYRYARARGRVYTEGRPQPGDLVFFRETYDQNRDGRRNDGLTHVGLVDTVGADGTVTVIHRVRRGVVRYRMNLERPHLARDPKTGLVLNDLLRHPGPGRAPVLTGQLFASYGSVLPAESTKPVPVALR